MIGIDVRFEVSVLLAPFRPGDSDLVKLRDSCAEKLAGQQQRRRRVEDFLELLSLLPKASRGPFDCQP